MKNKMKVLWWCVFHIHELCPNEKVQRKTLRILSSATPNTKKLNSTKTVVFSQLIMEKRGSEEKEGKKKKRTT